MASYIRPPPAGAPHQSADTGTDPNSSFVVPRKSGTKRPIILGLVAVLVVSVLTVGGIALGYFLSGNSSASSTANIEPVVVSKEDRTTPTASPEAKPRPTSSSAGPSASVPTVIRQFKSPSGNLRCSFEQLSGVTSVTCQQEGINYPFPGQACTSGAPGVFIAVNESGTYWPCSAASINPVETLGLDTPTTEGDMTCSINFTTGVTCYNRLGHGFTMEYDRGVGLF